MQTGSIRIRNGRWELQYRRPVKTAAGVEWRPTCVKLGPAVGREAISRERAEQLASEFLRRLTPPIVAGPGTVGHLAVEFLRRRRDLTPGGRAHYEYIFKTFIIPKFGAMKADQVTPLLVQQWLDELAGTYSAQTVRHVRTAAGTLFRWAQRYELVNHNPVPPTTASGKQTEPRWALSVEELRALLAELPPLYREFAEFLVLTGLRVGEALGLQRGDVNMSPTSVLIDGLIVPPACFVVRRAYGRHGYVPPKTPASRRVVPLTPRARAILEARLAVIPAEPTAPIWTGPRGAIIDAANTLKRVLHPAARRAGLSRPVSWHVFRHTAASLASTALDFAERQKVLGHTVASTTVRYTTPQVESVRQRLSMAIDEALDDTNGFDPCI